MNHHPTIFKILAVLVWASYHDNYIFWVAVPAWVLKQVMEFAGYNFPPVHGDDDLISVVDR
jgi:hypothetical protein